MMDDNLYTQIRKEIDNTYKSGYDDGYSKAEKDYYAKTETDRQSSYELGLNVAWEAARKICLHKIDGGMDIDEMENCFGGDNSYYILKTHSASEAIEKLREYEEQKKQEHDKIRVGDEVREARSIEVTGIVTHIDYSNKMIFVMAKTGKQWIGASHDPEKWEKTGRHFPKIAALLKEMQEGKE